MTAGEIATTIGRVLLLALVAIVLMGGVVAWIHRGDR